MKTTTISGLICLSLLAVAGFSSCEDMMSVDTNDKLKENANDTLYSYWGILKSVQGVAERQVMLGELRGDLVSTTEYVTDTIYDIANFGNPKDGSCSMVRLADYYNIINNCNTYINYCDTSRVKYNKKFMLPEYAQVQSIRAWTYLQMVQIYGEVPFVTEPILDLKTAENFDYANQVVNKDNLVDKFIELGLDRYIDTDYPNYGNYDTGDKILSSRLCFIPVRLVLGDMYLLRGRDRNDYRQAARYYYDYLDNNNGYVSRQYCTARESSSFLSDDEFSYSRATTDNTGSQWGEWASTYNYYATNEVITSIPGSANKQFGTMLTRVANIYGYVTSSSQSTVVEQDDNDEDVVDVTGNITTTPTYKSQLTPSAAYNGLNEAQNFVQYQTIGGNNRRTDLASGDARRYFSVEKITYEGEAYELCGKAANGSTFYYTIPIYRKTLVWLRLAEAINRAGFPQFAFAILKDGLNNSNIPDVREMAVVEARLDENGDTIWISDTEYATDTLHFNALVTNNAGAMYYADMNEVENFFLDFSGDKWSNNYGIHARGCGFGSWNSNDGTDNNAIRTNLTGFADSTIYTYDKLLEAQGIDLADASDDDIINGIENIIVDELALETAFEGNRFMDLIRIAHHKNQSGYKGSEWLADKVASRGVKKSKDNPDTIFGERDENIYSKLLNPDNWYLTKPNWK